MPISLTTIGSGASIDADVLKARCSTIERYVNEQSVAGDRTTNWLDSVHVFSPSFQYGAGAGPRVVMPGGEIAWCERPADRSLAALYHWKTNLNYVPVPGLCRTLNFLSAPTATFRVTMYATFYAFEYGGDGAAPNGARDETDEVARFCFFLDETQITASARKLLASSDVNSAVAAPFAGQVYARKQVTMFAVEAGSVFTSAGIHHVEVRCLPITTPAAPADNDWKHIFVTGGRMMVRHRVR
jgi:hypothetical protein